MIPEAIPDTPGVDDASTIVCLDEGPDKVVSGQGAALATGQGEHLVVCFKLEHLEHSTGRELVLNFFLQ